MSRVVCLDCFSGISGDMFAAAFVHAGVVSTEELSQWLSRLGVGPVEIKAETVARASIAGIKIRFEAHQAPHHLDPKETAGLVKDSPLSREAKHWFHKGWRAILEAEAAVHGTTPDDVHLHEMGHVDTIFDLICAALIAEKLRGAMFYLPRLVVGVGSVRTQHGIYPVPAPATAALLKEIPYTAGDVKAELATPTGAAILHTLKPCHRWPKARWSNIGYGAGARQLPQPNLLRVLVGEAVEPVQGDEAVGPVQGDEVIVILADVDDMSPEYFPYVQEKLLAAGAVDVSGENILMKKGRPGLRIQVMASSELVDTLTELLFRETTTLGVRMLPPIRRRMLTREIKTVQTPYGAVTVKLGLLGDCVVNVAPEHESCRHVARASGVPLKVVYQEAMAASKDAYKSPHSN